MKSMDLQRLMQMSNVLLAKEVAKQARQLQASGYKGSFEIDIEELVTEAYTVLTAMRNIESITEKWFNANKSRIAEHCSRIDMATLIKDGERILGPKQSLLK